MSQRSHTELFAVPQSINVLNGHIAIFSFSLSHVNDRIVILSIHQPRYAIFKQFDSLTLLSLGAVVYHGLPQRALGYFEKQGTACLLHTMLRQCKVQLSYTVYGSIGAMLHL